MLRSAAQRRQVLAEWRADPRNKGRQPPVEVLAPGLAAAKHATPAQAKAVQAILRSNAEALVNLQMSEQRALLPLMKQAQKELGAELKKWIERTPDGELRWSAWKYRSAMLQLHATTAKLEHALGARLTAGGDKAQKLALEHLVDEVGRFSKIFDGPNAMPPLRLNFASLLASGRASLVSRYETSRERYAWGKKGGVFQDLQNRLAVDILKGASVSETIDRLQEHGGPKGLVTLRGKATDEDAIIELVPEGLFARYRWRAEMYVRTELAAAYGFQMRSGLFAARELLSDLEQRWSTDGGSCPLICRPMDGQTVPLEQQFLAGDGGLVDHEPAHPNCMCRTGPWRAHWGALLDSLGIN